jgi:hypothetical protein
MGAVVIPGTQPLSLRTVAATQYVTPLREGGSMPAIVEADDDGLYVLKFRGAGQGPKALIAELVAGEIGRRLGLPVPEIVFVDLDPALAGAEPDPEIHDLLGRSPGLNLALDFLPGALPFNPASAPPLDPSLAAGVVWLDALTTNPDRTPRNTNLLVWHRRLWLIDHGAALYIHHTWREPAAHARGSFERIRDHVLLPFAGDIRDADEALVPALTPEALSAIVAAIPEEWLLEPLDPTDADTRRRAYVEYLLARLEHRATWVEEAERARTGA